MNLSTKLHVNARALTLLSATSVIFSGCLPVSPQHNNKNPQRMVVDVAGRRILVPTQVTRIACLTGASYEKAFLLGGTDKIVVRATDGPPWMNQTNPHAHQIFLMHNSHSPNVEELLKQRVEVAFFWDAQRGLEQLTKADIAAVVPQPERKNPVTIPEFIAKIKSEIRLYGNVLGDDSTRKANVWCDYYDRKVRYILDRTQSIPDSHRPKVYYLRGPGALDTLGSNENITWYGQMAGARMVIKASAAKSIAKVSPEQMMDWNPDVIFVGRQYSPDLVLKDARWQDIAAVRNRRVYVVPDGVFYWDSSSEGVLLLEFMAKKLYPDLFRDLNMEYEVKTYYSRFYHYELADSEVNKLLQGLRPDGERRNHLNN